MQKSLVENEYFCDNSVFIFILSIVQYIAVYTCFTLKQVEKQLSWRGFEPLIISALYDDDVPILRSHKS